jgi:predicted ATPase
MDDFIDGVYAVLLAPVTDAQFVATAIAQALDIFVSTDTSVPDQLLEHLQDKHTLLILDNMEHVRASSPLLVRLLEGCPNLKILVTSRSVLRLSWEREFPVPPLPVSQHKTHGGAMTSPSTELFIQRAKAVDPHYNPEPSEVKVIADICHKLDGLPLAIELAAARIKVLPPKEILSRLCKSLDILRGGTNDLPERHQAMRHTISWSYDLLKPEEQSLFKWLGVYAGGFSLEGAESVNLEVNGAESDGLELLTALRDQSLIRYVETSLNEPRYMMLETIREYALEKLREAGEYKLVKDHHVKWYSNCAQEASGRFNGSDAREWLDRVELDQDNFRAALNWCQKSDNKETGLRLCNALWRFWVIRGYMQEGITQITTHLEGAADRVSTLTRAHALNALATLMHEMSDYKSAAEILPEAIAAFRSAQDKHALAIALNNLSWILAQTGFLEEAARLSWEAYELHKLNSYKRGMAVAMGNLGFIALSKAEFIEMRQFYHRHYALMEEGGDRRGMAYSLLCQTFGEQDTGKIQECLPKIDEASRIIEDIGDRQMMAWSNTMHAYRLFHARQFEDARKFLHSTVEAATQARNRLVASFELMLIGAAYLKSGDLAQAKGYLEEALGYARHRGSIFLVGLTTKYCAEYALNTGDFLSCMSYIKECYQVSETIGNIVRQIDACELLALLYEAQGNDLEAIELLACADLARENEGIPLQPSQSVEVGSALDALQEKTGDALFSRHWSKGRRLDFGTILNRSLTTADLTQN